MREKNDPTRAGFTPVSVPNAKLSGNEIDAICQKAARGAGFSWGLAEESGFAARWLCMRGIDGCGSLLARLDFETGISRSMELKDGEIQSLDASPLCPIATGAALSDFAGSQKKCTKAGPVFLPVLVLPFAHQIARVAGGTVGLEWQQGKVTVSETGQINGALDRLFLTKIADIGISPVAGVIDGSAGEHAPVSASKDTLEQLNTYASRTYVPASAASRADAGSAGGDND
ncbi:DUF3726 domain-containing protein [Primorskyibacter sp. S87]|uniref:DUF3726 domain-containing protein n=1 Tax=Primorskyibacter sp. S87 TaxID=3415126 RepID=UPI003C7CA723